MPDVGPKVFSEERPTAVLAELEAEAAVLKDPRARAVRLMKSRREAGVLILQTTPSRRHDGVVCWLNISD